MNSTDLDTQKQHAIHTFFEKVLLPLRQKLNVEQQPLFPLSKDSEAESYFIERISISMHSEDFEKCSGIDSQETFLTVLESFWFSRGEEELLQIAPQLAKLAQTLKSIDKQTDKVSPFVYTMY